VSRLDAGIFPLKRVQATGLGRTVVQPFNRGSSAASYIRLSSSNRQFSGTLMVLEIAEPPLQARLGTLGSLPA